MKWKILYLSLFSYKIQVRKLQWRNDVKYFLNENIKVELEMVSKWKQYKLIKLWKVYSYILYSIYLWNLLHQLQKKLRADYHYLVYLQLNLIVFEKVDKNLINLRGKEGMLVYKRRLHISIGRVLCTENEKYKRYRSKKLKR